MFEWADMWKTEPVKSLTGRVGDISPSMFIVSRHLIINAPANAGSIRWRIDLQYCSYDVNDSIQESYTIYMILAKSI